MEELKGWRDLGVVSTIYEEDDEEEIYSDTTSHSSSLSPPFTPLLQSRTEAWSLAKGCEPDVLIQVKGITFHLHKEPLSVRSGYLRRKLNESSKITLCPSLNITVETFTLIANFCYSSNVIITPFNVVSLKIASELLEMTANTKGFADDGNLGHRIESYLCRYIGLNKDYTLVIFRSCLPMLPEAETIGCLVGRCIESLISSRDGVTNCIEDFKILKSKNFHIVAESLSCRLTGSHDVLYRIIDLYLKENGEKMEEEEKTKLCNCIDCTKLSPQLLIHSVQNPKMPLRFIVQAMFVDQLHTRRSIFSSAATNRRRLNPTTLGAILQRDAAKRHVSHLRASMDATCSKIKSLEEELEGMRKLLNDTESGRSVSSRFEFENKVERGQRGSVSSSSLRGILRGEKVGSDYCTEGSCDRNHEKSFRRKLVERVKSAFATKRKE